MAGRLLGRPEALGAGVHPGRGAPNNGGSLCGKRQWPQVGTSLVQANTGVRLKRNGVQVAIS